MEVVEVVVGADVGDVRASVMVVLAGVGIAFGATQRKRRRIRAALERCISGVLLISQSRIMMEGVGVLIANIFYQDWFTQRPFVVIRNKNKLAF